MTPTLHLRFIERQEIVERQVTHNTTRTVRMLQQFWEHTNGKDVCGDTFVQLYGSWRDVPTEVQV